MRLFGLPTRSLVGFACPFACLLIGMILGAPQRSALQAAENDTQIGKRAPEWELVNLEAGKTHSNQFKGKVQVLNFWATWCPPCRAEIPHFKELAETYKDRNVVFVGISLDQSLGPVKRFHRTEKMNYPLLMGHGDLVQAFGGFSAIPQTFVVDAEGRIHKQFSGLVQKKDLQEVLEKLAQPEPKESV
ncbi:MAG: TlpA disulfide reductase family protein [Verrucomicrobiales bacterium]